MSELLWIKIKFDFVKKYLNKGTDIRYIVLRIMKMIINARNNEGRL